jgi:hypothetical protein
MTALRYDAVICRSEHASLVGSPSANLQRITAELSYLMLNLAAQRVREPLRFYLSRTSKVQDAHCWWWGGSRQTVVHRMPECRKWRRERDIKLHKLITEAITTSARRDRKDLKTIFEDNAAAALLRFVEDTAVGTNPRKTTIPTYVFMPQHLDRCSFQPLLETQSRLVNVKSRTR